MPWAIAGKLKKIGVGFALEHYGVDCEKFQILDMLKPDYIKVDGELMHSLMTDKDTQSNVERIVQAASERDIKSIAERVENANAMAVLFQLGLDYMQGHYVNEPEVVLQDGAHDVHVSAGREQARDARAGPERRLARTGFEHRVIGRVGQRDRAGAKAQERFLDVTGVQRFEVQNELQPVQGRLVRSGRGASRGSGCRCHRPGMPHAGRSPDAAARSS